MYLLNSRAAARPSSDRSAVSPGQSVLAVPKASRLSTYASSEALNRLRAIEPDYVAEDRISYRAIKFLRELRGEKVEYGYAQIFDGGGIGEQRDAKDMARAMILVDRSGGFLDPLALNLIGHVLNDFAETHSLVFRMSSVSGALQVGSSTVPLDGLKASPLRELLKPIGLDTLDLLFAGYFPMKIQLRAPKLRVSLSLVTAKGELQWSAGGVSRLDADHRRLAADLNLVIDDYRCRKLLVQEYGESSQGADQLEGPSADAEELVPEQRSGAGVDLSWDMV